MRILKIIYATLLFLYRLAIVPFVIIKNFVLLRYHRRAYKNQLKNGSERFFSNDSYLAALRSQMGKDIDSALGSDNNSCVSSDFLR